MKFIKVFVFLILFPSIVYGGNTYYIDYNAANDSANGTSKSTPWKRAPGMQGFTGSYSHGAGDRFILKGGVTWTGVFPWNIANSGTSGNVDYYGIDATWYSGGSWTRPKLDGQNSAGQIMTISSVGWIYVEGIEFTGAKFTRDLSGLTNIYLGPITGDVTFDNIYIHNWDKTTSTDSNAGGGIYHNESGSTGAVIVKNSTIYNNDGCGSHPGYGCGGCMRFVDQVINSHIGYCAQGLLHGGRVVRDNEFDNMRQSFDSSAHSNVLYIDDYTSRFTGSGFLIYRNKIHDNVSGSGAIYLNPGVTSDSPANMYVYDNLIWNYSGGGGGNITVDTYGAGSKVTNIYVYNNTIHSSSGLTGIRGGASGRPATSKLAAQNNHCITTGSCIDNTNVTNPTPQDHNLTQTPTQASAVGYIITNYWQPTSSSSPTVNQGTAITCAACMDIGVDLKGISRLQGSAWDIGAYKFESLAGPSAPKNLRIIQ